MQEIMNAMDIAFPNLGIYLKNVPRSFSVGGLDIYLYAVVIVVGMLCGIFMAGVIMTLGSMGVLSALSFLF